MICKLIVLLLAACAAPMAQAAEHVGDALFLYALQDRTAARHELERGLLALIDNSPDEDRFELYRSYDQLMGTWAQLDLSQALLAQAVATSSPAEEEKIRTMLRDQARFALWELEDARSYLQRNMPAANHLDHVRINQDIRSLLFSVEPLVARLLADQCAYVQCGSP
jgi:hypothetical protein